MQRKLGEREMKLKLIGILGICVSLLFGMSVSVVAKEPPVAKLVQVTGIVEYSRNGTDWRKVRRTKYLFAGYHIKTGDDSSGKLIDQKTGMAQTLGASSQIEVGPDKIQLVAGSLSEPKAQSGSIFQGLSNKFAKAQRYTTVRRSVSKEEVGCNPKVRTIRKVAVSSQYPDLVWRNACPEYSYRLVIDDRSIDVPAQSTAEMIRYEVSDVKPGVHIYRVEVLDIDGVVYIPKKDSAFRVMSKSEEKKLKSQTKKVADDVFVLTDVLEANEMFVAAMDAYRVHFQENPDDNDMRPLLIKSYNDLKLSNLKESEARLYNASLEEDY
jgi:hypothetical protein